LTYFLISFSFSFSSASFFSFSYLSVSSFPAISSFFLISFLFRTFLDSFSWFLHFFSCFFLLSLTASFSLNSLHLLFLSLQRQRGSAWWWAAAWQRSDGRRLGSKAARVGLCGVGSGGLGCCGAIAATRW
jgi:hypothetical protein